MKIEKESTFTILQPELLSSKDNTKNIANFYVIFNENYSNFKNDNLILDFSKIINIDLKEILLFSPNIEAHTSNRKSFVIVCNVLKLDELPTEIVVVPTLQEAKDIIELEEIERDLGI